MRFYNHSDRTEKQTLNRMKGGIRDDNDQCNPSSDDNAALNASAANALSNYTGNVFTIGYGWDTPEQIYVSGIEISVVDRPEETVPVPGSLLLLGAGLLGFRFARRKCDDSK